MIRINKLLLTKAVIYRSCAVFVHSVLFGLRTAVLVNAVNLVGYFLFDKVFFRWMNVRVEHEGLVVWLTGLPCSGKTTIAVEAKELLEARGYKVAHLDGDNVRETLCSDLGFSKEDRRENLKRVAHCAKFLSQQGTVVLCSFVSPYKEQRDMARQIVSPERFLLGFVSTPADVCARRDVKGMYAKARAGEIKGFTGVDGVYELPGTPGLLLPTVGYNPRQTAAKLVEEVAGTLR